MAVAMQSVQNASHEISTNRKAFCTQWGITGKGLEGTSVYRDDCIRNLHNEYWAPRRYHQVTLAAYLLEYDKIGP